MLAYSVVGTNDLARALAFYDELLDSIGIHKLFDNPRGGRLYGNDPNGQLFAVFAPFDGQPATVGNGSMSGFSLPTREAVAAFHVKALSLGATDEGAPGLRGPEAAGAYFAYVRDPDGNKLCAYRFG